MVISFQYSKVFYFKTVHPKNPKNPNLFLTDDTSNSFRNLQPLFLALFFLLSSIYFHFFESSYIKIDNILEVVGEKFWSAKLRCAVLLLAVGVSAMTNDDIK